MLHDRKTGQTRRDRGDRLKCPQDGSFETVPRIFHFLIKKKPKKHNGQGEKKTRSAKAEPKEFHSGTPCKQKLKNKHVAERHVIRHVKFYIAAATLYATSRTHHAQERMARATMSCAIPCYVAVHVAAHHAHMCCMVGRVVPFTWQPPRAPPHNAYAHGGATLPPSLLPRGGPRLGGLHMALVATTISSKPHFSFLTIFSLSPFPIPLVIPSFCPRVRF